MVAEAGERISSEITEELELGFGKCSLQVQVPEASNYKEPKDLVGKKVATSFDFLAAKYFADLEKGAEKQTSIEYVGGSVEAACALGLADGIGECAARRRRCGAVRGRSSDKECCVCDVSQGVIAGAAVSCAGRALSSLALLLLLLALVSEHTPAYLATRLQVQLTR